MKNLENVYVEVEPSNDGSDHLKVLDDVNQPSTSYSRKPRCAEVDFDYQLIRDR